MLILAWKEGESFMIGDNIEIVIVENCGHKVRIGIRAPADVPIHRAEVLERMKSDPRGVRSLGTHDRS